MHVIGMTSRREYEYCVPIDVLRVPGEEDVRVVERFGELLRSFEGTHKFHNFTRAGRMQGPKHKHTWEDGDGDGSRGEEPTTQWPADVVEMGDVRKAKCESVWRRRGATWFIAV